MKSLQKITKELRQLHSAEVGKIKSRLAEFTKIFETGNGNQVFAELVFCLLTPQSKAKSCWAAVKELTSKNLLLKGSSSQIAKVLRKKTRFHNNKAKYIVEARELFKKGLRVEREWLIKNIKGMGYKEAGHFLRNIGLGKSIAILDRHILKILKGLKVIKSIPKIISKKEYLKIEKKMAKFAKKIGIPLDHLDLLFWRKQTGEYFK